MEQVIVIGGIALVLLVLSFYGWREQKGREGKESAAFHRIEKSLQAFIFDVEREIQGQQKEMEQLRLELKQQKCQLEQLEAKYQMELSQVKEEQGRTNRPLTTASKQGLNDVFALNRRYQPVFQRLQSGMKPEAIAQQLGMGVGEIDLIVQLANLGERHED